MKKLLLTMAVGALLGSSAYAETVTDVITGSTFTSKVASSYYDYENIHVTSEALYAANMASGATNTTGENPVIQLRSANSNSGVVSTTSGGYVRKITITWNAATASARTLQIYGSNTAYESPAQLYDMGTAGTLLGAPVMSDGNATIIPDGDYEYIGIRSKSSALYLDEITIEWELPSGEVAKTTRPVITGTNGFYPSSEVSISAEEGAVISYYVDYSGEYEAPATITEVPEGWSTYSEPFTLTADATVYAIAKEEEKEYSTVAKATFTKAVVKEFATVEALNAAILDGTVVAKDNVVVTGNVVVTTYSAPKASQIYMFVQDLNSTAAMQVYSTKAYANAYAQGDVLSNVIGVYGDYGKNPQLTATNWIGNYGAPVQTGVEVEPTVIETIDFVPTNASNNLNQYVEVKNIAIALNEEDSKFYMTVGEESVQLYDRFGISLSDKTFDAEKTYNVVGYPIVYNTTLEFFPLTIEEYVQPICETPVISLAAGTYTGTQTVTLTCATEGASIRYTLDGSTPSATEGTLYEGEFEITASCKLQAIAYMEGATPSEVAEASYVIETTGIDVLSADNGAATFFTVSGAQVAGNELTPGLYIRVANGKATKVIVR